MFTDMKEALEAEALELTPIGSAQSAAASLVVAHQAHDKDDLADLLGALGLPCGEDDLVTLLPHLTAPDDPTTGVPMPVNAFTATAASMLKNGDSPAHVRETLGLPESELAEALQHTDQDALTPDTDTPQTAGPASDGPVHSDEIKALLSWAKDHPAAVIRNKAARIRSDLSELTARRQTDDAQREAEERVAKLKAELEQAQETLRTVKAGGRPTMPAMAPVPIGTKRSKEQLAAIRTWARANGHQVADKGNPAKAVLDAYDAAHRTTDLAEAS
ncbi:Lsr2 [Streptomyces sp. ADI91-18]|uniref:Lsr2 family DNA-binding protein n=1 Tax=Streptomyces sp. ADI91-18 TaxID=1522755 RepID=UPI000F551105|nr:histone-like nucleoid-structuring protein Lsr2 [Streptomyces sp. ADI91-18]RPK23574.1 Lsr2 [Streptomyces sp. ADI91-18]